MRLSNPQRLATSALLAMTFLAACGSSDGGDGRAAGDSITTEVAAPVEAEVVPEAVVEETVPTTPAPAAEPAAAECPSDAETEVIREFSEAPPMCLTPGATYSAFVSTTAGDITIDLDAENAPTTVNNFVFLARNNYFDDTVCHRVIQEFVAQCGDPSATGMGGPGYSFLDELPAQGQYEIGSIAMANSGPDTNGSQFFIISGANGAGLPPLYSLFGQVPEADLGVVAEMNARGSLDSSGITTEEVRILDVVITES